MLSDRFHPHMIALIVHRRSISLIIRPSFSPKFCLLLAFDSWAPDAFSSPPACSRVHSISHCPYYLWDEGPSAKAVRSKERKRQEKQKNVRFAARTKERIHKTLLEDPKPAHRAVTKEKRSDRAINSKTHWKCSAVSCAAHCRCS